MGRGNEHYHRNIIPHRICGILDLGFLGSNQHDLPRCYDSGMRTHLDDHHCFLSPESSQQGDDSHIFEITVHARKAFEAHSSPENIAARFE
jgi:hypothetical protein